MRSLSLQQFQQTGGIFISQSKNLVVTVIAAVSVIEGEMTLGMLLAVQFIIGQLNIPIEQLMQFLYNFQNVRLSIERISAIHGKAEERTGKRYRNSRRFPERISGLNTWILNITCMAKPRCWMT